MPAFSKILDTIRGRTENTVTICDEANFGHVQTRSQGSFAVDCKNFRKPQTC